MSVEVTLEEYELRMGMAIGAERRLQSLVNGAKCKAAKRSNYWDMDIEAALAELAVAKVLGVYWPGTYNTFKTKADIGENIEVRHGTYGRKLIVRQDDHDTSSYVLAVGLAPTYVVHGWLLGKDCKKKKYLQDPGNRGPAYFVDKDFLKPLSTLEVKQCLSL